MGVISGINWGSTGISEGNANGTVSDKTNNSYTCKHTISNALSYRSIRIFPDKILPANSTLTKIIVDFNFRASTGSSHRAAVWEEGEGSTDYLASKSGLSTTDTAVSLSVNASSLTKHSDGSYRIGIGGYKSALSTFYWYISNFSISLEYTIPTYTVTTSASPTEGGTVTGGGTFESGAIATVTAISNSGYKFCYWLVNGANFGNTNPIVAEITANYTVEAVFEKDGINKIYVGT